MTERWERRWLGRAVRRCGTKAALIALFGFWVLAPFYFLVVVSFTPRGTTVQGFSWPGFLTLENYRLVVSGANTIWPSLSNSAVVSIVSTAISLIFAVPAAYGLSQLRDRPSGRLIYLSFFILRGIPPVALVIPYYLMFSRAGLLNSLTGLVLALVPIALPFAVWTLRVFFDAIPRELDEAARMDGANLVRRFLFIALPMVKHGVAATGVLSVLLVFVDYIMAVTLGGPATRTFAVYVTSFQQDYVTLVGPLAAASIIGTLPMIVLYATSQRYMQRMAIGGIQ
jgi:multiple sugar transport system permease protein